MRLELLGEINGAIVKGKAITVPGLALTRIYRADLKHPRPLHRGFRVTHVTSLKYVRVHELSYSQACAVVLLLSHLADWTQPAEAFKGSMLEPAVNRAFDFIAGDTPCA